MKHIASASLLVWIAASIAAAQTQPALSAPEEHHFTFTQVARAYIRNYAPQPLLDLNSAQPGEQQAKPENVLVLQQKAYYSGDFEGWLNTWNDASAQKWRNRLSAQGTGRAKWEQQQKSRYSKLPKIRLTSWVAKLPYVLIAYEVVSADPKKAPEIKVAAFRLTGKGVWKASLDLENDPAYQALAAGKIEVTEELPR